MKLFTTLLFIFILIGCAEKPVDKVKVKVSAISAAGIDMPGGMLLYGHNNSTQEKYSTVFENGQDTVLLNNGEWDLFIVGWKGPSNMEGEVKCGAVKALLEGEDTEVAITVSNDKCINPGNRELKFIQPNQFQPFNLNSCSEIPATLSSGSTCYDNQGGVKSFRLKLITKFANEEGLVVKKSLSSNCYELSEAQINASLLLPYGGSEFSHFITELEVFSGDNCSNDVEKILFTKGFTPEGSIVLSNNNSEAEIVFNEGVVSLFVSTPDLHSDQTVVVNDNPFITRWTIAAAGETITLPLRDGFNYNFIVDWGDGSSSEITSFNDPDITHAYSVAETYTVTINGIIEAWYFNNDPATDKDKLIAVDNLGDVGWKNLDSAFAGCSNLEVFSGGNTSAVTTMKKMFFNAPLVIPDVSGWDTSNVTDMSYMFHSAGMANPDVSNWNTMNVTNMSYMFYNVDTVNPDTSSWNTSNVTDMSYMFHNAGMANPDVSNWNTSNVTNMSHMFFNAYSANPSGISNWDTSSVTNMYKMFFGASIFNQFLDSWDVSNVNDMGFMFANSGITNIGLQSWDTTSVTNMQRMFQNASGFMDSLSNWSFANVTNMTDMFSGVTLDINNYSQLLVQIENTTNQTSVTFNGGNSQVNSIGRDAKINLEGIGWNITDGGFPADMPSFEGGNLTILDQNNTNSTSSPLPDGNGSSSSITVETDYTIQFDSILATDPHGYQLEYQLRKDPNCTYAGPTNNESNLNMWWSINDFRSYIVQSEDIEAGDCSTIIIDIRTDYGDGANYSEFPAAHIITLDPLI